MGILEDFGYDDENNDSYSPDAEPEVPAPLDVPTDVSALRKASSVPGLGELIVREAKRAGIDPLDLATAMSYETGGTFNPRMLGPQTKNGQGRGIGLIQFMSNGSAKDYGITQDTPADVQVSRAVDYLIDRGVKPGMKLLDIYSAINAGRPGLYNRSDAGNGGAPGTVRDKVNSMSGHRLKAAQLLGKLSDGGTLAYAAPETADSSLPAAITKGTNYVRPENFVPGAQGRYVPPQMRGPFPRYQSGTATVGAPVTPSINLNFDKLDPSQDYPGMPQDEADPVPAQLAALLKPTEPVLPVLDESAGLNLAKTASNISIPSVDPAQPEVPSPVLPNLPTKDQTSLLVQKGNILTDPNPPSVPRSGDNIDTTGMTPEPQAPVAKSRGFMGMLDDAMAVGKDTTNMVKQFGAKVLANVTGLPFEGAAMVAALADQGTNTGGLTQGLINEGQRMRQAADFAFGVGDPKTIAEKGGALFGKNLTPMGAQTGIATGGMVLADMASNMISTAMAAPTITKAQAEELLFPGIGNNKIGPQVGPRASVTHTVQTAAGPAKLDDANFRLLGYMGAATIGALAMPSLAKTVINSRFFSRMGRDVINAPAGVQAFSNRMDLLRTYDDKYAGIMRISRDLGVHPQSIDEMQKVFDFQSGSGSRALTNAAVVDGQMMSANFQYQVNTSVGKLAQAENDMVTQYMHLWNQLDEVKEVERVLMTKSQAAILQAGVPTVRGMNKYQINQAIRTMEASPDGQFLKDWRTGYLENQKATRQFEATGEYATLSAQGYKDAQKYEKNKVWQKLDEENTNITPLPVSETMGTSMTTRMRERMENEAKGLYIDNLVNANPDAAQRVTHKELEKNRNSWGKNVVEFYRRGKKEYWVTDPFIADVLKMDPYMLNGPLSWITNGARNLTEKTTTGVFAPWFSTTNMIRNHHLIKVSEMQGFKTPNVLNTMAAIPQQLYPQLAKGISQRLNHWSEGYLGTIFDPNQMQALATKLAQVYDQSVYAGLSQRGGVHTGMFLDYNREAAQSIQAALASAPAGIGRTALGGLKALFESIHNAPVYAYASKNIKAGRNATEVAMAARDIVGNPNKVGQYATRGGKAIRFGEAEDSFLSKAATAPFKAYGLATEVGRNIVPWWNVTTQGMKRVGKAYIDNPAKFIGNAYLYQVMPAAAVYMYNRGLGLDPNGISYNDYQMNRRSGYNSLMTMYIAIPGRPAEDGIVIPLPHELAVMQAMTAAGLHHLTHSELFSRGDDYMRTALAMMGLDYQPSINVPLRSAEEDFAKIGWRAAEVGLVPATPPVAAAIAGGLGFVAPNGPFGQSYQRKNDPYDSYQGLNTSFELVMRALAPGIGDIVGSGFAAYTHAPDAFKGMGAGVKAMSRRVVEKTPIVRDAIGWKTAVSGSTDTSDEMFKDRGILRKLTDYYTKKDATRNHEINAGKSKEGTAVADLFMPTEPPTTTLGLPQPKPVNALYSAFMEELDRRLNKDVISERGKGKTPSGGIGFPSHMARYSAFTQHIKDMRNIDEGNAVTWRERIKATPELEMYLRNNNIPIDQPRMVRNFLEHERQTSARQIMFTLKAVEQEFQQRLGDPKFSFDQLDPNKPYMLPPGMTAQPFVPQWPAYAPGGQIMRRQ